MSIGRTPDAAVFLDDVTVSRNHALLVHRQDGLLHRRPRLAERHLREPAPDRVAPPQDGDEIQIGKYKLSYLEK